MVTIYTKSYCPYCHKALALLDSLGVKYANIDCTEDSTKLQPAIEKSGITTVPQVFSNDTFIGGCDDIHALHANGELLKLLK